MTKLAALASCLLLLAVCQAGTPEEWKSRTIYQVLTDRYNNPTGTACSNLGDYCGGTFAGLEAQLDYITGMGFDAMWISPVITNTPGGYHGYWAEDLFTINTNFGTPSQLLSLVKAAHAKGVWVMVDVVANHMGNTSYSNLKPFDSSSYFHNCNGCPPGCSINNFNDLPEVIHCKLASLPDLNQTMPHVSNTLQFWVKTLVSNYTFDGIRVDTVPEVSIEFWPHFTSAAGVYSVGEVFNGDVSFVANYQGALSGLLSYPLFFTMRNVYANKQSMYQLQSQWKTYNSDLKDVNLMGTFLDNHDNARFLHYQSDTTLYKNALVYTLYSAGIPIIYYGTEQAFNGGNDPANREPLWPTHFNTDTPLYAFLKAVISFRKQAKLWTQPQVQRYADDSFYAFTRGTTFVASTNVGSHGDTQTRTITYQPYANGTMLCNLFWPDVDNVTVTAGSFDVHLTQGEVKIYSPDICS